MATIQWFPGHMSKARRQVQENLKHVDFVTILVDARLPLSSQNPMLTKIVGDKPKLLILNKADLADSNRTKEWRTYFESQGIKTLAINSKEQSTVKLVTDAAKSLMADKIQRLRERGIQKETLRTMIIGIPNAGKSTLMNRLAGKKIAVVGNKPGVTKGQQWLKSNKDLEILDTPGILWPKFEDELVGLKLALTGAIKDQLLPMDEVTIFGLNYFKTYYPERLEERFKGIDLEELTLHVGAGTFKPVKSEEIEGHEMHTEFISVRRSSIERIKSNLGNIIAVGTTSVRTLESLYYMGVILDNNPEATSEDLVVKQWMPYEMNNNRLTAERSLQNILDYLDKHDADTLVTATQIIIAPGYEFKIVKGIVTNFHQPKSTLLLLISAFVKGNWKSIYEYALEHDFRFLSYGDSSLLL